MTAVGSSTGQGWVAVGSILGSSLVITVLPFLLLCCHGLASLISVMAVVAVVGLKLVRL